MINFLFKIAIIKLENNFNMFNYKNKTLINLISLFLVFNFIFISTTVFAKKDKIFISDLDNLGKFEDVINLPEEMFEGFNNNSFKEKGMTSGKKVAYYFITKKKTLEKYPHNMMKAMAYFEIYFLQTLKDKENNLDRFREDNYNSNDIHSINTLLSLNKARESMRKAVGLTLEDSSEEAIKRFWLMNTYLSKGKIKTKKIDTKIRKKIDITTDLKSDLKGLQTLIEKDLVDRLLKKDFNKELKNYLRNIKKKITKLKKIDLQNIDLINNKNQVNIITPNQLEEAINIIDKNVLSLLYNDIEIYSNHDELQKSLSLLDLADYSLSKTLEFYPKKYVSDLSEVDMSYLSEEDLVTINKISSQSKINNKIKNKELLKTSYTLENINYETVSFIEKINNLGIATNEISISYQSLEKMKTWSAKDWASSYKNEIPKEIYDENGDIVEVLSDINIEDIKAQIAIDEFRKLSDEFSSIANDIKNENLNISKILENTDFSIKLDKYDKFFMIYGYNDFNDYVTAWNSSWDRDYSRDELVDLINQPQNTDIATAINEVDTDGLGFDAGALASSVGMELADVATQVANAVAAEVSVDLEAVSKGLGYSSFSDAVSAYNKKYGTNYTDAEAKEALGL